MPTWWGGVSHDWMNPANWDDPEAVPTPTTSAYIVSSGANPVLKNATTEIYWLQIWGSTVQDWGFMIENASLYVRRTAELREATSLISIDATSTLSAEKLITSGRVFLSGKLTAGYISNSGTFVINEGASFDYRQSDYGYETLFSNTGTVFYGGTEGHSVDYFLRNWQGATVNVVAPYFFIEDGSPNDAYGGRVENWGTFNANDIVIDEQSSFSNKSGKVNAGLIVSYGSLYNIYESSSSATGGYLAADIRSYGYLISDLWIEGSVENYGYAAIAGTINGNFSSSGVADLYVGQTRVEDIVGGFPTRIGAITINGDGSFSGGTVRFDIESPSSADKILIDGDLTLAGANLVLRGLQAFAAGETHTLFELSDGAIDTGGGNDITVTGQHADFAYWAGVLASTNDFVFRALNSGETGGHAILDQSAATVGTTVVLNAITGTAGVRGGLFAGDAYYRTQNVDEFVGTALADTIVSFPAEPEPGEVERSIRVSAGAGKDTVEGAGGADWIDGGAGDDSLTGGGGADTLRGGANNDIYLIDLLDSVVELAGAANGSADLVHWTGLANQTYTLANNVENLTLTGTAATNGSGNTLDNKLIGNSAANILSGLTGKDTLTGSGGNDVFKFSLKTHSSANHAQADIIMDFDDTGKGNDTIDVSALFGAKMVYRHGLAFTKTGQVRINDIAGADVIVEVNISGTLAADFAIRLKATTLASMTASDFVL